MRGSKFALKQLVTSCSRRIKDNSGSLHVTWLRGVRVSEYTHTTITMLQNHSYWVSCSNVLDQDGQISMMNSSLDMAKES